MSGPIDEYINLSMDDHPVSKVSAYSVEAYKERRGVLLITTTHGEYRSYLTLAEFEKRLSDARAEDD